MEKCVKKICIKDEKVEGKNKIHYYNFIGYWGNVV
jgi:hypothetical protein